MLVHGDRLCIKRVSCYIGNQLRANPSRGGDAKPPVLSIEVERKIAGLPVVRTRAASPSYLPLSQSAQHVSVETLVVL
jgi:hypothetical protein